MSRPDNDNVDHVRPKLSSPLMSVFIPLLENDNVDDALLSALRRIGPVILSPSSALASSCQHYYTLLDHDVSFSLDDLVGILDKGAEKVIIPLAWAAEVVGVLPAERVLVLLGGSPRFSRHIMICFNSVVLVVALIV